MRRIPLSGKYGKGLYAMVDDVDYDPIKPYKWRVRVSTCGTLYAHTNYWDKANKRYVHVQMHRMILGLGNGRTDKRVVDHKDKNGLNNRRDNIRVCTASENQANRDSPPNKLSGLPRGVGAYKNRYFARIQYRTKGIHLGYYQTIEDSARAYNLAANVLFGPFSTLNVLPEDKIWDAKNAEKVIGHLDRNRYWDL